MAERALFELFPELVSQVPIAPLGDFPTPVQRLTEVERAISARVEVWAKRDDLSSAVYGGNKVRTLEVLFGRARADGATRIYATGALGTNHGLATVLHAPRAGLEPGLLLFPQPESWSALENLRAIVAQRPVFHTTPHWSTLPFAMWSLASADRRAGIDAVTMVPGGATPEGALGYVSAGLELARQVQRGEMPAPAEVVVGVGSTCTSAGLLVGLVIAARRGFGLVDARGRPAAPRVTSVRVTPWPVTSHYRIAQLAAETSRLLARLTGDASVVFDAHTLGAHLQVTGRFLGNGYGLPTARGRRAIEEFERHAGWALDTTYSGKSAAYVLSAARAPGPGPIVYWSTKSSRPLPPFQADDAVDAPPAAVRWLRSAEKRLAALGELPASYPRL